MSVYTRQNSLLHRFVCGFDWVITFHVAIGCRRIERRQPRPTNPKIIVPTTAAAQTQETTKRATTQSAEVTTVEKATTVPQATTQNSEVTAVPPETTKRAEVNTTTEKATTVPPATTQNSAEVTTTERNVAETTGQSNNADTTSQSAQLTRPSSLFGFQKSFGLPNVVNTESCTEDLNGTCREECEDNEYRRGRFDCQGVTDCCVLR